MAYKEYKEGYGPDGKPLPKITDLPEVVPTQHETPGAPIQPWEINGGRVPEIPETPAPGTPFSYIPTHEVTPGSTITPTDLAEEIARRIPDKRVPDPRALS